MRQPSSPAVEFASATPLLQTKTPGNGIYVASYLWHFAESSLRLDLRYLRILAETRNLCLKR